MAAAAGLAGLVLLGHAVLASRAADDAQRGFLLGVYGTFTAALWIGVLLLGLLGLALAVVATTTGEGIVARGRRFRAAWPRRWVPSWLQACCWLGLAALGLLAVLHTTAFVTVGTKLVGVLAAVIGLTELLDRAGRHLGIPADDGAPGATRRLQSGPLVGVVAGVVMLVAGGAAVAFHGSSPAASNPDPDAAGCNGSVRLCDRKLSEIWLAGTRNSMSVASEPAFLYTEHNIPIEAQLSLGYRALLLDTYNGWRDGRIVRTELSSPVDVEQVRREYGAKAAASLQNLRLAVGGVPPKNADVRPWLCHIVCELGASDVVTKMRGVRDFLDDNPNEVLVFVVQDSITPKQFEGALREAGLFERVWHLQAGDEIPTLRQMILRRRNVLAMSENHGGELDWYPAAYHVMEETPYSFSDVRQFTCRPNRGAAGNPFFLVNHWVRTGAAPTVAVAARANAREVLLRRVRACAVTRGRTAGIIAVDFAETGDVPAVVAELNARLPAITPPASPR